MSGTPFYPRLLRPRIEEALRDSPVVLIHGVRQCGKTTLARIIGEAAGFTCYTFDDDMQLSTIRNNSNGSPCSRESSVAWQA